MELFLLFASSFLAATLLPAQSEALLASLAYARSHSLLLLFVIATLGNVLGACLNWWLGRAIARVQTCRWFPFSPTVIERASQHYQRFGIWSLLFSWLPIIGDPLTLISGILRTPFPIFLLLVTTGKATRYALILWVVGRYF